MTTPWWKTGVNYEIYPRSFQDTDGDGVGDLKGIIQHLDYLNDGTPNSLGVDAIWLTPFYPSPFYDFGYDVKDYCGIDPMFGTMEDFDTLIEKAHKRGIKIVIDLVFDHTSHRHPWFIESRLSKDSPKRDWYIWKDTRPNNWKAFFGGSAWTYDKETDQYYLHSFLPEQPDLNWRNRDVREALFDIVRFWMDKGVDGFRLDVINFIYKDREYRSNPFCFGRRPYEMQHHIYDRNQPEAHQALQELRQLVDLYGEKMLVGEIALDKGEDSTVASAFYGKNNDELHLAFNFEFLNCSWKAKAFRKAVDLWESSLPPGGWPNYVLSNHDMPRHYSRYARWGHTEKRAKIAAMMLLTLRGTPFLYYGEEIGMRNVRVPRWKFQDPVGKRYWPFHPGRDEERTPMQWNTNDNAGFTIGQPWLPLSRDYKKNNVQNQLADPDSLLSFYRRLIWLRKKIPTLLTGDYRVVENSADDYCYTYLREDKDGRYLIALNFSSRILDLNLASGLSATGQLILSTLTADQDNICLNPLKLCGNEGMLIKLK